MCCILFYPFDTLVGPTLFFPVYVSLRCSVTVVTSLDLLREAPLIRWKLVRRGEDTHRMRPERMPLASEDLCDAPPRRGE